MPDYARMLDKRKKPTPEIIARTLGPESADRLARFEASLAQHYNLQRELRFPFGNNYGWGYKFGHGRKHLCYAFFEEGAFTVTLQISDAAAPIVEGMLPSLSDQARAVWEGRHLNDGQGGWMHYRVLSDTALTDLYALIGVNVKPVK